MEALAQYLHDLADRVHTLSLDDIEAEFTRLLDGMEARRGLPEYQHTVIPPQPPVYGMPDGYQDKDTERIRRHETYEPSEGSTLSSMDAWSRHKQSVQYSCNGLRDHLMMSHGIRPFLLTPRNTDQGTWSLLADIHARRHP